MVDSGVPIDPNVICWMPELLHDSRSETSGEDGGILGTQNIPCSLLAFWWDSESCEKRDLEGV